MQYDAYIGTQGYTLNKSKVSKAEFDKIKTDLWIGPKSYRGQGKKFPMYRESAKKIYLPRYYGLSEFGVPTLPCRIHEGTDISVPFAGDLRPHQKTAIDAFMDYISDDNHGGGIIELPCSAGKCLGKNTPILMFNGAIKMSQDIVVGDVLMGDDSTPRQVTSICKGIETMYRIKHPNMNINDQYVCNESHILSLNRNGIVKDIPLKTYLSMEDCVKKEYRGYKSGFVEFNEVNIPKDAYQYASDKAENNDLDDIDPAFIINSGEQRFQFLMGIVDNIGIIDNAIHHLIILPWTWKNSKEQMLFLLNSLGFVYVLHDHYIVICSCHYDAPYTFEDMNWEVTDLTYHIEIDVIGEDVYYGFELNEDSNRRFVLGNFVVTHNTVMGLNLIAAVGKKTAIVVGKEFLMNQWIKEAAIFLPTARIGKIQGQTIDIEDKDIVLIMLQSLCQKDYPSPTFASFGFTIIDECHHMSSEHFSKSLFKLVTKYTLGISATVERKDGTSNAFKMFLGDVIYSGNTNEDKSALTVYNIKYLSHDEDFEEVIVDYKGEVAYSSMVTKLSQYNRRSEFILQVITDILAESQGVYPCQIMVLSQNISLLKYFHSAITHRNIAEVGYYIGGMSEAKLSESETKQIVLASYSMASEGLNIRTLTTILYASPRTEIKQSSGRIRYVNEHSAIYDIVDSHLVFQRQWNKRKKYYQSENFNMLMCTSDTYKQWQSRPIGKKAICKSNTGNGNGNGKAKPKYEECSDEDDNEDNKDNNNSECLITL